MKDDFGKENRYRPLISIGTNQQGRLLLQTSLMVGDESSFYFSAKDLSPNKNKYGIITDSTFLTDFYLELLEKPDMDIFKFIKTSMALTSHIN
jgi:hypothetical protein